MCHLHLDEETIVSKSFLERVVISNLIFQNCKQTCGEKQYYSSFSKYWTIKESKVLDASFMMNKYLLILST